MLRKLGPRITLALASMILPVIAVPVHAEPTDEQKAESVLRRIAEFEKEVESLKLDAAYRMVMEGKGFKQEQQTDFQIRFARPNRFAVEGEGGPFAMTVVSDGEKLYTYYPSFKKYTVDDAPKEREGREAGEVPPVGGGNFFAGALFTPADELVDELLKNAEQMRYLDEEEIDGQPCHHLAFEIDGVAADLWVEKGEQPLVRRLAFDMSEQFEKAAAEGAGAGMFEGVSMKMVMSLENWEINPPLNDGDFQFEPPSGAEEVDSIFEAMAGGAGGDGGGPHPLVGTEAPDFELPRFEGEPVQLDEHADQVVVLDFWATWCPPCVEGLPKVAGVAKELEDEGVVFYAVNVREDEETVRAFLERQELAVPVLLDTEGTVSDTYGANAIPQTVLIGKDGRVQVVHTGFSSGMETQLREELQSLLDGEDLAAKTMEEASKAAEETTEEAPPMGLVPEWTVDEAVQTVAVERETGTIYAGLSGAGLLVLDASGETQGTGEELEGGPSVLRTAKLGGDGAADLLGYSHWGSDVRAYRPDGTQRWSYQKGQGVNDVWPHDLNGDGLDEVIIGYNGFTGIHVLDHRGEPVWEYKGVGNVWHVTAGRFGDDQNPQVVTTSAQGAVHFFSHEGEAVDDLRPSCYANMVRVADPGEGEPRILVGGTAGEGTVFLALDRDGRELWNVTLTRGGGAHIDSAEAAIEAPLVAVGMRGGTVHVVQTQTGQVVARTDGQGTTPQLAWSEKDGQPLLLIANGQRLGAFRLEATDPPDATGEPQTPVTSEATPPVTSEATRE